MRIFIFFLCLGLCVSAVGAQVRPLTLSNLCAQADRVVVGGVNKIESRWEGSKIVTDVTIAPTENLKGVGSVPFAITVPGGTVDGVTLRVSAAPVFAVAEQVVLFRKTGPNPGGVYGWYRGKYTVVNGHIRELVDTTFLQFKQQLEQIIENL